MAKNSNIETDLEDLRRALPDPFKLSSELDTFFNHPVAQSLIAGGEESVRRIIAFLENCQEPPVARIAVILLSRFASALFYQQLLTILEKADKSLAEAFEPGLWLIQLREQQIAQDLVRVVSSSGNPYPLLLLQRPVAKQVRSELGNFIRQRQMPLSLYALYDYGYALEPNDIPLLKTVSEWVDIPELSALAGLYALRLGSKDGLAGIRVGLMSSNEELRTITYYELGKYLSKTVIAETGYDATKPGDSQRAVIDNLIEHVTLK
jgi:hypothetical protein